MVASWLPARSSTISPAVRPRKSGRSLTWVKSPGTTRLPSTTSPSEGEQHPGQHPQQVGLAGAVRADQGEALAVVDLVGERQEQPVVGRVLHRHRPAGRVPAPQAGPHRARRGGRRGRARVAEASPSGSRRRWPPWRCRRSARPAAS